MRFYGEIIVHEGDFMNNYRDTETIVNICCEQCLPQMRASHPEPERIQELEDVEEAQCCICGKAKAS